jgi:hypothetical protein
MSAAELKLLQNNRFEENSFKFKVQQSRATHESVMSF